MKKILFITKSMGCGGVERTLINLLKSIDNNKYNVSLMLTEKAGEFLHEIPENVNIIELPLDNKWRLLINDYGNTLKYERKKLENKKITFVFFVIMKFLNKLVMTFVKKNLLYDICIKKIDYSIFDYDIVCDYHGYGFFSTYFASVFNDDVIKLSWIHEENIDLRYQCISSCYLKFDKIIGVSKECINNFHNCFNYIKIDKLEVIHNLVFEDKIRKLSQEAPKVEYCDDIFTIVSVGRLTEQKGFDLAIKTANLLRNNGHDFLWIIIGDGKDRKMLQHMIDDNNLNKYVVLHGFDNNPFPYIKRCSLYVQTSRYEGFVTTITEAIILGKAIVSTKFSGVAEQVIPGKNGFITSFNELELSKKIEEVMSNSKMLKEMEYESKKMHLSSKTSLTKLYDIFNMKKEIR